MSTDYEKMFFEEHKKISQLKFYWNTENDILYEAQTLSEALRKKDELSIDNIFNFNQVLFDYNQEEVDHILDYFFTPSNMLLVIGGSLNDWKTLVFEQYEKDAYATDKHTKTLSDR
jgi:secreted Zn-dependent insulinase-like peptidase